VITLSQIFLYPVKGLRGFSVNTAEVDALGLVGDRRFLIVNDTGEFLTQRTLPNMARIAAELTATDLILRADGDGAISVPLRASTPAPLRTVWVWRSKDLRAEDCGREASAWLSAFLGLTCHLVRIGDRFRRPVLERRAPRPGESLIEGRVLTPDLFNFADGFPFLAIGEASLTHLNDRLVATGAEPVPMNRFRPNLVVAGTPAFAEDAWPRVQIGPIVFRSGGPCARCIVTTTDQFTGERDVEPLRTLASYRRDAEDSTRINFGLNLTHETKSGTVRLGDAVTVLP
jgi:uncharacterized protein YcbX